MAEKCPACGSCGMPMEKPEDFALGDVTRPYCRYCTDARGELLPFEKVLETNARFYVESQGVTRRRRLRWRARCWRTCRRGASGINSSRERNSEKEKSYV